MRWLILAVAVIILASACATPASQEPTASATASPSRVATAAVRPSIPSGQNPKPELQQALANVSREFNLSRASSDLAASKQHAQTALNILVGTFGRWYMGGGNETQGVLPGERVPGPAPDVGTPVFPTGWLMLVYNPGDGADRRVASALAGNIEVWGSTPRKGYDEVAAALSSGASPLFGVPKLAGPVPRMVGYARLITLARSMDDARTLADRAAGDAQESASLAATLGR